MREGGGLFLDTFRIFYHSVKNHRVRKANHRNGVLIIRFSNTKTYIESNENSYIHERVHVCIVINITVGFQFRIRLVDWILLVLVGFC